ncbi:hypothetical protein N7492_001607 [Penicillium capsulatum]|uniref:Uncharacterized protein n=1 Tax=Penicillium capsulatum TaxID=69766 RepID=A0A9W9IY31_9EURO|nr:hypothetical protein N7492_001607 [Penicillium capsulatum]KAJ6129340.1 hypothetical protein N7512_002120 [Penicillium capsulatum]
MRYTLINGLLLLASSPFTAALPVDPSTQPGQWDPSGQYRKGHYDQNGQFIPNVQDGQVGQYQNGQYQNGQWNNGQDGYDNRDGRYNNGGWQRRSVVPQPFGGDRVGDHRTNIGTPGILARNWPYDQNNQNGWTDQNGQWHPNNQNGQGWTDQNGQWHPNNQNGQGWTDQNGQWHPNQKRSVDPAALNNNGLNPTGTWHPNNQNGQGWTDQNGQWHANQKREWRDDGYNRDDRYNYNNGYDRDDSVLDRAAEDVLYGPLARRWWPFNHWNHDNDWDRNCDNNDWNCRNRYNNNGRNNRWHSEPYRDQCQGRDWRSCRGDNNRNDYNRNDYNRDGYNGYNRNQATPTPSVVARQFPSRKAWTRPTSA